MAYLELDELRGLLRVRLEGRWAPGRHAGFSDSRYWAPPRAELEELAGAVAGGDVLPSVGEAYDCDDYAFALKGLASQTNRQRGRDAGLCFGIVWGQFAWLPGVSHAANWAVDDTGEVLWIEPQDGSLEPLDRCLGDISLLLV